jgi:Sap, sulfolipid-1-addressing protein
LFLQAAGFALLAAVSPSALLIMTVYLGSGNPRKTATAYVAGAVLMTIITAVGALVLIRAVGLAQPSQHAPRYGLRLGVGVLALASAAFVITRKRPADGTAQAQRKRGFMSRLIAEPSPATAFVAGVALFAPSATFLAAVQVVATAREGIAVTTVTLLVITVLALLIVLLPLAGYLAAPEATTRRLGAVNQWLRAYGRTILVIAMLVAGSALILDGVLGLTS